MSLLLDRCLQAFGDTALVASKNDTEKIIDQLESLFPLTRWGRIAWNNVAQKEVVTKFAEIEPTLARYKKDSDHLVFIIWNDASLPAVLLDLRISLEHILAILDVNFDTFLFSNREKYVIEFYHHGPITIGFT